MKKTSIETYKKIKDNGLLSQRRMEVYEILFNFGPLTAHEVVKVARNKYPEANQTGFNARLSELEKMGVVNVCGEKVNPVSGCKNSLWETTDHLPIKIIKNYKQKCLLCNGTGTL
jgi:Fe2+ or Zn2+ uptake regulation protein